MKVLLTGAFGNVGLSTLEELSKRGHQITVFELKTKKNLKRNYSPCCHSDPDLSGEESPRSFGHFVPSG